MDIYLDKEYGKEYVIDDTLPSDPHASVSNDAMRHFINKMKEIVANDQLVIGPDYTANMVANVFGERNSAKKALLDEYEAMYEKELKNPSKKNIFILIPNSASNDTIAMFINRDEGLLCVMDPLKQYYEKPENKRVIGHFTYVFGNQLNYRDVKDINLVQSSESTNKDWSSLNYILKMIKAKVSSAKKAKDCCENVSEHDNKILQTQLYDSLKASVSNRIITRKGFEQYAQYKFNQYMKNGINASFKDYLKTLSKQELEAIASRGYYINLNMYRNSSDNDYSSSEGSTFSSQANNGPLIPTQSQHKSYLSSDDDDDIDADAIIESMNKEQEPLIPARPNNRLPLVVNPLSNDTVDAPLIPIRRVANAFELSDSDNDGWDRYYSQRRTHGVNGMIKERILRGPRANRYNYGHGLRDINSNMF